MTDATYLQTCTYCKHEFRAAARYVGRSVACPTCRQPLKITDDKPVADKLSGRSVGGCTLRNRLGAGALGVVYEAVRADGSVVAVKLLSSHAATLPEVVARFQREAALTTELHHPNLVAVHDCGHERGAHYLVMDYVAGGSLAGLIEDQPLLWIQAFTIIAQVADAVGALHMQGIVHRDIKPANILLTEDMVPLLADLGLAKDLTQTSDNNLTMSNVAMGSPAYMPPEQIRDAATAGPPADVYALGVTLFECMSGHLPYRGRNGADVMAKVLKEPIPELALKVPVGARAVVRACLAKDAGARPPTAVELAVCLRAVLADPDNLPAALPRPLKKSTKAALSPAADSGSHAGQGVPWWAWLIAAVIVASAIAAAWYLING